MVINRGAVDNTNAIFKIIEKVVKSTERNGGCYISEYIEEIKKLPQTEIKDIEIGKLRVLWNPNDDYHKAVWFSDIGKDGYCATMNKIVLGKFIKGLQEMHGVMKSWDQGVLK